MTTTLSPMPADSLYKIDNREWVLENNTWMTFEYWCTLDDKRIEQELAALNISLSYDTCHPFKHNRPMFAAWEDGNEESGVVGYGTTEAEAITNFKKEYAEKYYY